jgi:hypothetical protein
LDSSTQSTASSKLTQIPDIKVTTTTPAILMLQKKGRKMSPSRYANQSNQQQPPQPPKTSTPLPSSSSSNLYLHTPFRLKN